MNSMYFKEASSESFHGMVFLHDYIMCICIIILSIVSWFTFCIVYSYGIRLPPLRTVEDIKDSKFRSRLRPYGHNRHRPLEIIWTIFPTMILGAIAVPSFSVLYAIERPRFY